MTAVGSRDTEPEIVLRRALRGLGRHFRLHPRNVPGHPDLIFPRKRVAVFVDGDFWHGRQWRLRGHPSLADQFARLHNRAYWIKKITRNMERDAQATRTLKELGWRVVRVWESDIKANLNGCVRRVSRALQRGAA